MFSVTLVWTYCPLIYLLPLPVGVKGRSESFSAINRGSIKSHQFNEKKTSNFVFQPAFSNFVINPWIVDFHDTQKRIPLHTLTHTGSADLGRSRLFIHYLYITLLIHYFTQPKGVPVICDLSRKQSHVSINYQANVDESFFIGYARSQLGQTRWHFHSSIVLLYVYFFSVKY